MCCKWTLRPLQWCASLAAALYSSAKELRKRYNESRVTRDHPCTGRFQVATYMEDRYLLNIHLKNRFLIGFERPLSSHQSEDCGQEAMIIHEIGLQALKHTNMGGYWGVDRVASHPGAFSRGVERGGWSPRLFRKKIH